MPNVWTTTVDRADGYVVGQTVWNQLVGATGNLQYLYDGGGGTKKYKTATQTFSATTALADITASSGNMAFAIAASEVWMVEWIMLATFTGTGGLKFQVTGPAAPTAVAINIESPRYNSTSTTPVMATPAAVTAFSADIGGVNASAATDNQYSTGSNGVPVIVRAFIQNGANAGTITLQGAQNSANGTTVMGIGSRMRAERLA